jgi:hypothetical protein
MEFYKNVNGFRDDLGNVKIVKYKKDVKADGNYLVWSKKPVLILNQYKTSDKFGRIEYKIPLNIMDYLTHQNKQIGDLMISKDSGEKYGSYGNLSSVISTMLKRSGVKTDENTNDGAVNLLRHSFITNELSKITTAEDRLVLSEKLAHSPITTLVYIRKLK